MTTNNDPYDADNTNDSHINRQSIWYRTGRTLAQLANGQTPTSFRESPVPNSLLGKKSIANVLALTGGRNYFYAYDEESGDVYDLSPEMNQSALRPHEHNNTSGLKITKLMNVKEYQPVHTSQTINHPGFVAGPGKKGRKYKGIDAIVKALILQSRLTFCLDFG